MTRLSPKPDFVCFLGDMIAGLPADHPPATAADKLRAQWNNVLTNHMTPLSDLGAAVYRIGSNHDSLDASSEAVWREVFADIPANGPPGQEGLSYFVRRDDCLVIGLDVYATALGAPATAGGRVDVEWVDRVLTEHADARYKLVLGHTPVFPVYRPRLCVSLFDPRETRPNFWTGPEVPLGRPLDVTVAIEPGMGPGQEPPPSGLRYRRGSIVSDLLAVPVGEGWTSRWCATFSNPTDQKSPISHRLSCARSP